MRARRVHAGRRARTLPSAALAVALFVSGCQSINDVSEFVITGLLPDAGGLPDASCGAGSELDCPAPPPCTASGAFEPPEAIETLSVEGALWGPALSGNGLTLFFSAGDPERIFYARRADRDAPFGVALPIASIDTPSSEGTPFPSSDGLALYFHSTRAGGPGGRDIWLAKRAVATSQYSTAMLLPQINTAADEQNPWLSPDELSLVFDSTRSSGQGAQDLWMSRRAARSDDFGGAVNLRELNGPGYDQGPALSGDALSIFFASNRPGGRGDLDIWQASREATGSAFSTPENVRAVNGAGADLDPALSSDGTELFFSSMRDGLQRLYRAVRPCQ